MKVLYISKSQVSAAYQALPRELSRLGVDLTVVVPRRWGNQVLENATVAGYEMRVLPCALSGKNHFYFYTRLIEDDGFDMVHLDEEPWSLVSYQWVRQVRQWHKPLIFFTWQNIEKHYPPPFHYFEHQSFGYAKAAIAGSRAAESVLRVKGFVKPIVVLPQLGVDAEVFRRTNAGALRSQLGLHGRFVIGYVGRMVRAKGINDLVQALPLLPPECVLVMVGEGEARAEAEARAHRLGVAGRIRWIPQVPSLQVPEYMSLFDVLALPSRSTARWKEQFGRVLVEAMACGTPPVGSTSAEIPNVIGDAGLIFPEGDVSSLAERLRSLYENQDLRNHLAQLGRQRVLHNFTHRRIAEGTTQLYCQVLGETAATPVSMN